LRAEQLRRRIAPFMLRRDKSEVLAELPPKTEILSEVELSGAQRDLYETIRIAMHEKVRKEIDKKGLQRSQIVILDALLKLRQVCCDPRLLKMDAAKNVKQSAKLDMLGEMLPEMVAEGRRILLFSQFTMMLKLIEEMLAKAKIPYVKLTGQTRDRATPIDRFQKGEVPVFLISLKAGGSGLNLTTADTVIHYDPWWNPATERQATDRAHRIGQDKSVFVYKFITKGTLEEKISAMQARKQQLADAVFDGSAGKSALSADDLQALFEPLQ
jgi:SNF2 family DNA or RNA helicase